MKKCLKCSNVYDDTLDQCPECRTPLISYTLEDTQKDRQEFSKQQIKKLIVFGSLVIVFLLGFGFKSCTGIKKADYKNLQSENEKLQAQYDELSTSKDDLRVEFDTYKTKMKPYEEQQAVDEKAAIDEQNRKAAENVRQAATADTTKKETSSSTYGNSEAETKHLMQLFLDDFQNDYPDTILKVEAYSDKVFNIWFSNDWYSLNNQEKESLANNLYTSIKNRYIEVSGKSDGIMSLTLYDPNSKTLAKSKTFGGIELK